jgi:hypothetical protein
MMISLLISVLDGVLILISRPGGCAQEVTSYTLKVLERCPWWRQYKKSYQVDKGDNHFCVLVRLLTFYVPVEYVHGRVVLVMR